MSISRVNIFSSNPRKGKAEYYNIKYEIILPWKYQMGVWNRKSKDPLLRVILDRYRLNLLSIPRERVAVGDLYMRVGDSQQLSSPGSMTNFIEPKFEMPEIKTDETMADVIGTTSSDISSRAGLDLLEGFLNALGTAGIGTKVKGAYEGNNKQSIKFQFTDATRDYVDPFLLGSKLTGHTIMKNNALYEEGRRYYVVSGIARSPSISVISEGDSKQTLDIDAQVMKLANASGGISIEKSRQGQVIFKGNKRLAFGVELYELAYNSEKERFIMNAVNDAMALRGPVDISNKSVLIGDSEDGDAFVTIK